MIEFINGQIVTVGGQNYDATKDLEFVGDFSGPQRPYMRSHTKLAVYKEIKMRYPELYNDLVWRGWFAKYVEQLKDVTPMEQTPSEVKNEVREDRGEINMNNEVLEKLTEKLTQAIDAMSNVHKEDNTQSVEATEKLTQAIENISDKNRIEFAKEQIEEFSRDFITKFVKETYGALPQRIEIVKKDVTYDKTGLFHEVFPTVLKLVNMNLPVMLTGPAGTGKNFLLEQVAQALNMDFYYTSSITQEYKLTGFIDGGGTYHETEFYKACKDGGLFMLDEIDASIPECLVILNGALANGYFDFPTGRVKLHENCRIACAGNTVGLGADMVYTGRNVIDGATLDRFALVSMDYDKRIEENLCQDEELRDFLYDVRKSVKDNHINHIVGMRCLKYAYQMLVNDFDKDFIVKSVVLKGLQQDDINVLKASLNKENPWSKYVK